MNEFLELTKSQLDLTRQVIAKSSYFLWIIYHIMKEICLTVVTLKNLNELFAVCMVSS